jgi:hypothetical protein
MILMDFGGKFLEILKLLPSVILQYLILTIPNNSSTNIKIPPNQYLPKYQISSTNKNPNLQTIISLITILKFIITIGYILLYLINPQEILVKN